MRREQKQPLAPKVGSGITTISAPLLERNLDRKGSSAPAVKGWICPPASCLLAPAGGSGLCRGAGTAARTSVGWMCRCRGQHHRTHLGSHLHLRSVQWIQPCPSLGKIELLFVHTNSMNYQNCIFLETSLCKINLCCTYHKILDLHFFIRFSFSCFFFSVCFLPFFSFSYKSATL